MEKEKSLLSGGERPATKGKGSCVLLLLPACWAVFLSKMYLFIFYSFTLLKLFVSLVSVCSRSFYLSDAMTLRQARRFSTFAV